ncbi:MAG: rhomboid family intramembrane serine protease [Rhizobiaceae bacterium]|nr:rhomboid family intramembrane serine protease [Rhizobiaceae bacterium]
MTESQRADPRNAGPAPQREPLFNLAPVVTWLIVACVGVHILRVYWLDSAQDFLLLVRGAFIPARYSGGYLFEFDWLTSPITYAFLHGGAAHLVINMIWLAAFGSPLANRLGAWPFLLFWIFTGLAAAGLHFALHPTDNAPLIGASGAISGMMGAAARFGFRIDRSQRRAAFAGPVLPIAEVLRSRGALTFLGVWFVVNLVTGLVGLAPGAGDQIAWEAHIGGFVAGFFCISLFVRDRNGPA